MGSVEPEQPLTYEDALDVFLGTDPSYADGLSNHGPMAIEALVHMGVPQWIGPFVGGYRDRLEPVQAQVEAASENWRGWLRTVIEPLVPAAGNLAGHGLLRVAHAVRALERIGAGTPASFSHRVELATGIDYWRHGGPGLDGPRKLTGTLSLSEWLPTLGRLRVDQRSDGLLTETLGTAAATTDFAIKVAALAPMDDPTAMLDALGTAAGQAFMLNDGLSAFTLLHGTTVSSMASVLLPHLDEAGKHQLVASVAGFVAAAIIGFDDGDGRHGDIPGEPPTPDALAEAAGASCEDHTIKFVDACVAIAARTGDTALLAAAHRQITTPYGNG